MSKSHNRNANNAFRNKKLLAKIEKRKELSALYERFSLPGFILIDGHHLLIEVFAEIEQLMKNLSPLNDFAKSKQFIDFLNAMWAVPDPGFFAEFFDVSLIDELTNRIIRNEIKLTGSSKTPWLEYQEDFSKMSPSRDCIVGPSLPQIFVFDTPMPNRKDVLSLMRSEFDKLNHLPDNSKTLNRREVLQSEIALIESGKWRFFTGSRNVVLPYEFKDKLLKLLCTDRYKWQSALGKRIVRINDAGRKSDSEKGVDARLVIKACDIAADKNMKWVCLITNDSDYVPAIERLLERGKSVYLAPMCDEKFISTDLRNTIGGENIYPKRELFSYFNRSEIFSKIFTGQAGTELLFSLATFFLIRQLKNDLEGDLY